MPVTLHHHAISPVITRCRVIGRDDPIAAERRIQRAVRIESHQAKIVSVDPRRTCDKQLAVRLDREPFGEIAAAQIDGHLAASTETAIQRPIGVVADNR